MLKENTTFLMLQIVLGSIHLSPFQLQIAASVRERALLLWLMWLAATVRESPLLFVTERGYNFTRVLSPMGSSLMSRTSKASLSMFFGTSYSWCSSSIVLRLSLILGTSYSTGINSSKVVELCSIEAGGPFCNEKFESLD